MNLSPLWSRRCAWATQIKPPEAGGFRAGRRRPEGPGLHASWRTKRFLCLFALETMSSSSTEKLPLLVADTYLRSPQELTAGKYDKCKPQTSKGTAVGIGCVSGRNSSCIANDRHLGISQPIRSIPEHGCSPGFTNEPSVTGDKSRMHAIARLRPTAASVLDSRTAAGTCYFPAWTCVYGLALGQVTNLTSLSLVRRLGEVNTHEQHSRWLMSSLYKRMRRNTTVPATMIMPWNDNLR